MKKWRLLLGNALALSICDLGKHAVLGRCRRTFALFGCGLALSLSAAVFAQDEVAPEESVDGEAVVTEDGEAVATEDGAPAAADNAVYLPLKPPFIVNYGGAGRLRYIKTDISVRLVNVDAAHALRYHMPFVRNNLLKLLAAQTTETVSSQEGKEKILVDALEEIRSILQREHGTPPEHVMEVFFNNFIVQK